MTESLIVRWLGRCDYHSTWQAMQQLTNKRDLETPDEIWLLEHDAIFTQGQNSKTEHLLRKTTIPIIKTDRGGQITYHGPGQLMVYTLLDLKRKKFTIRDLINRLQQSVIDLLATYQIPSNGKCEAPGVYVQEQKICSIGLRVRKGCTYHGIAFNIAMDLTPFSYINPCGFPNLQMTDFSRLGGLGHIKQAGQALIPHLTHQLAYTTVTIVQENGYEYLK